ncbi:MAG TPA: DUF4234 domain-containing protein [Candidatus Binatia bacterium]|jgi:hypothetical protein|nr:DUF4234 domain-containing protein [Candidatus Binatia bacterium]
MVDTRTYPIAREDAASSIPTDIILSIVTCGIYNLFWQARQFRALNAFIGKEEFRFWSWFFLTLITCGIYHVYTQYRMGLVITEVNTRVGRPPNENLALISLLLSVFGLVLVADAIQQSEINGWFDA